MVEPFLQYRRILSYDIGTRNLGVTLMDCAVDPQKREIVAEASTILHADKVDILEEAGSKAKNSRTVPLERLTKYMVQHLHQDLHLVRAKSPHLRVGTCREIYGIDAVVIEQQPQGGKGGAGSKKLYALSYIIETALLLHCIARQEEVGCKDFPHIKVQNARMKLGVGARLDSGNLFLDPASAGLSHAKEETPSQRHTQNKKYAVVTCDRFMEHLVTVPKAYKDHSRKHDVADCILQGAYFTLTAFTGAAPLTRRIQRATSSSEPKTKRKMTADSAKSSASSKEHPKRRKLSSKKATQKPSQTELEEFLK